MKRWISRLAVFAFVVSMLTTGASALSCREVCGELARGLSAGCQETLRQMLADSPCLPLFRLMCLGELPQVPAPDEGTPAPDEGTPAPDEGTPAPDEEQTTGGVISAYEAEVIRLVNEIRRQKGLGELTASAELSQVARLKSQDMHDKGYFDHNSPTYGSAFDMLRSFGISYGTAGENIAYGYSTPQAVVDAWMNSSGHRANILNASYTQIGVGHVQDGNYCTQIFVG